jgi:hypothetical protein
MSSEQKAAVRKDVGDKVAKNGEKVATPAEKREAARREYEKRLTEAWKKGPRQQSSLAVLIQSDTPIKDVAAALLHQYGPRRPGKPGGWHLRWQRPHYLVAYMVERTSPRRALHMVTDQFISRWIEAINGWAFMRDKTKLDPEPGSRDHERVKKLLRGSKRQRP